MTPHSRPAASERKLSCAPRQRLAKAAGTAVEALEKRQLLAASPALDYSIWLHPDPAFRRDLLAEEHAHPQFAALLEADLRAHGLPALDPAAAALLPASGAGSGVAAASAAFLAARHGPHRHLVRDQKSRMHPAGAHLARAHHAVARGHHPAAHHTVAHHVGAQAHHPRPHHPRPVHGHFGFAVSPSGPMVNASSFTYKTLPQNLAFTFSEDVHASLSVSSITVLNTSTGATLTPLSYSWSGLTATFNLTASSGPILGIPDGYYTATLNSQTIKDAAGNTLVGPNTLSFSFLNADVEQDGTTNQSDMNLIVANYGKSFPVATAYQSGDVSFDANNAGNVGFDDLTLVQREYYTTLNLKSPAAPTASQVTSTSLMLSWPDVNGVSLPQGRSPQPTPNTAVGYNVYRNGTLVANDVVGTTYVDGGLSPSTAYTYSIASMDDAGEHSVPGPSTSVTTKAPPVGGSYNVTPPLPPTSLHVAADSSNPDSALDLSWTASTSSNVSGYEIDRWPAGLPMAGNAAEVGYTPGTSFVDTGLDAGQGYNYAVEAYDPTQDRSSPATIVGTVGPDTTAPDKPSDLQATTPNGTSVSLSWVQPWDNVGVTNYLIYRNGTQVATANSTTWTDSAPPQPLYSDSYYVVAKDAAGNMSPASSAMSPDAVPVTDTAPNEYIPPSYLSDFYSNLTAVLRQRIALVREHLGANPYPAARQWLDIGTGGDTVIAGGAIVTLQVAPNILFSDSNGTGQFDPWESAWVVKPGENSVYNSGDQVLFGSTPAVGTPGRTGVYYADFNGNGQYDPGEALPTDPSQIHGAQGTEFYADLQGIGKWAVGDPIWDDTDGDGIYQAGDTIRYGNASQLQAGVTFGKTAGLNSYDYSYTIGSTNYSQRLIWVDNTTFRQDFAAFYPALEAIVPYFQDPNLTTYPGDAWSLGSLLDQDHAANPSINSTPDTPGGSITVTVPSGATTTFQVTGSGTHFGQELKPGDSILINGSWYQVDFTQLITDTQLTLAQPYAGSAGSSWSGTLQVRNWTRVPTQAAAGSEPAFTFERGRPDANSLIFPQQFQELHYVLGQLNQVDNTFYDTSVFDQQTSANFIRVATKTINAYEAVFGMPSPSDDALIRSTLVNHMADPGAIFKSQYVISLRNMASAIGNTIYAKTGNFVSTTFFATAHPITWSLSSNNQPVGPGKVVLAIHLSEIENYVQSMLANGLWLPKAWPNTTTDPTATSLGVHSKTLVAPAGTPLPTYIPDPDSGVDDNPPDASFGTSSGGGRAFAHVGQVYLACGTPQSNGAYSVHLHAEGVLIQVHAPDASNPDGGSAVDKVGFGSNGSDLTDLSALTWGATDAIDNLTTSQIYSWTRSAWLAGPTTTGTINGSYDNGRVTWTSAKSWFFDVDTSQTELAIGSETDVYYSLTLPSIYGAPDPGSFSYSPSNNMPPLLNLAAGPMDTLPLTSQMDYQNVIADTDLDGIVQAPQDLQRFGADTGLMAFQAQRDMAQSYLPIYTDTTGALPIHGYLAQGGFGTLSNDVGTLRSTNWTYQNVNENGVPYAYSLDTRVQNNMLVTEAGNHVKRVEVVRPEGNSVVFDFAWNSTTNSFSPIGKPMSWQVNGQNREGGRLYVLRDLTPNSDTDLNYELLFPSGIIQTFNGSLVSVTDSTTGLTQTIGGGFPSALGLGQQDTGDSTRYNITVNWAAGKIASINYQTKDAAQTIQTVITYGSANPDITALTKTNGVGGATIAPFSYALANSTTITSNNITITRTGSVAGTATIKETISDPNVTAASYVSDAFTFNSNKLITNETVTLSEDGSATSTASTTYTYATGTQTYSNGAPQWGKVTLINYPDNSWEAFTYDGNTGWMTEDVTPFKSSTWSAGSEASQVVRYETYAAADSGGGMGSDSTFLVERPRTVTTKVLGVVTAETFNRYGNSYDASGNRKDASGTFMTREASTAGGSWANAGLWSNTQINAFDAVNVASAAGAIVTNKNFNSSTLNTTYNQSGSWFGTPVSQSQSVLNPFGNPFSGNSAGVGRRYDSNSTTSQDSYDRVKKETLSGGLGDAATYIAGTDWLGPSTVTETDGSKTKYTYTALGQVATKIIYSGLSNSVKYAYTYDAGGNLVQKTTTAVDTSGNPVGGLPVVTNTYAYDALGRLTKEVDDYNGTDSNTANRTTTDVYTLSNNQNVITATYPGGTTRIENDYLDGTPASVSGTAVTPATYDEGVISTAGTDANGNADANVLAGSRWGKTISGGSSNTTIGYANLLGEQYLTQQSAPSATSSVTGSSLGWKDATASFDGNGRQTSSTDVDGSITLTQYDPTTGQPAATVQDVDQDGTYLAGTDRKSIVNLTPLAASDTTPGGSDSQGLYAAANTDDNATTWNGGLNSSETINGQTTSAQVSSPAQGGYTNTITNPDGTQVVDTYTSGLLTQEQKLGTDQATVIWTETWNYDGLRRLSSYVDYMGTTSYGYFEDGTQKSVTLPGHSVAQTVNTLDQPTEAPTQVTRPDNASVSQPLNSLGLASSNSGAGTIPARLGYDTAGTGAVTSLETYTAVGLGTLGTAGTGATTAWGYDQSTGMLASKTYADYSLSNPDQIKYQYNAAMQLAKVTEPGITADSFGYNGAGEQTSFSYNDSVTGVVSSNITSLDELGRHKTVSDTDNGSTFATTTAYTTQDQLFSEQYASAGGAGTQHVYFPTTGFGSAGAPGALQTLTVAPAPGSGAPTVQTTYGYDATSKRLNTIIVNGITFTVGYLTNSDQVQTVAAAPTGSSTANVTTQYNPDTTDPARLGEIKLTNSASQTLLDESITGYYGNDQRHTETVTRTNPGGASESHSTTFNYNSQDELTGVTDYLGGGNYSYAYDNAGNRSGTSLGTATNINEYPALQYNARGDLINDGTNSYTWDAKDRLIAETPDAPVANSTEDSMGYDSQGRLLWQQVSRFDGCNWNLSSSKEYVWDLNHIVAELDGNNNNALLESYTWSPTGLLAVTTYPTDPNNPNPGTTKTYEAIEDASGSVVELLDPTLTTGNVVAAYHYDPFGTLLSSSGVAAAVCPFGFQQMLSDPSGKYYDNARWYDPVTGRFESRDPAGETTTDPNPFAPFGNDPINKSDPTGLETRSITQISLEAIDQAKRDYGDAWLQNYDWIYKAKVDWYRARNIDIVIPPNPDGAPSMYYLPPTNGQVVKQYAKEVLNAVNANTGAVVNLPATVVNNQIANWHNDFRYPVVDNRAGIYQLPIVDAQVQNDYNADPNANAHTATLTNAVGAASSIGLFVAGVPRVGPSAPAAASNIVVDTGGVASAPFRFTEQSLAPAGSVETPAEFLTRLTQEYKNGLPTQATPVGTPASVFEIQNTGPLNYLLRGGGVRLWADGINQAVVLEAKFIGNAETSPFIAGSRIPDQVRQMILADVNDEFRRLSLIIRDGANPLLSVRVITNNAAAKGYFESLLKQHNIPGEVVVR